MLQLKLKNKRRRKRTFYTKNKMLTLLMAIPLVGALMLAPLQGDTAKSE